MNLTHHNRRVRPKVQTIYQFTDLMERKMPMVMRILSAISLTVLCFADLTFAQKKTPQDSSILALIKNEGAFHHWQSNWEDLLPTFNLDSFQVSVHPFPDRVLETFLSIEISSIDHPSMIAFSPNGQKAVAYGYAETCGDDYCSVFLYDFDKHNVIEISEVGHYFPPFNGFAWLRDDLLIEVGISYRFAGNLFIEAVAPTVTIFDFKSREVHGLTSKEYIPISAFQKNHDAHVTVEPDLMLDFEH